MLVSKHNPKQPLKEEASGGFAPLNRGLPVHEFLAFQIAPSDKHNWLSRKEKLEAAKS